MQVHPTNWDLLRSRPHMVQYRYTINGTVYPAGNIRGVPKIEKPMMLEPVIGRCCTGSFSISVERLNGEEIPKSAPVRVECRIVSSDKQQFTDWVPQGRYWVVKRSGFGALVTLSCRDAMQFTGRTYHTQIADWPASASNVLTEIAGLLGVSQDPRNSVSGTIAQPEDGALISEVLSDIAAVNGGNFIFNEQGQLRFVPFPATSAPVYSLDREYSDYTPYSTGENVISRVVLTGDSGATYVSGDNTGTRVSGKVRGATQGAADALGGGNYTLSLGTASFPSGSFENGTAVIEDSALSADEWEIKTLATGLLNRRFTPYRLDGAYLDPCVELGDTISINYRGTLLDLIANTIDVQCTSGYTCEVENGVLQDDEEDEPYVSPREIEEKQLQQAVAQHDVGLTEVKQDVQTVGSNLGTLSTKVGDNEADIKQFKTWQTKTDTKIGSYATLTGIVLDADGNIVYDTDSQGNKVPRFDTSSQYSIKSGIEQTATSIGSVISVLGDNGVITSNSIIQAINADLTTTTSIKADRIELDGVAVIGAIEGAKDPQDNKKKLKISADSIALDGAAIIGLIEGATEQDGTTRLKISADSLDLSGVLQATAVTTQGVTTYKISGKELVTAVLTAGTLKLPVYGSHVDTTDGAANAQKWTYEPLAFTFGTVGKGDGAKTFYYVGYGNGIYSQSLNHSHDITFDEATGVLTLGQPILGSNQTTNFNVASSTWFKNQMAGAKADVRLTSLLVRAADQTLARITRLGPDDQLTHYYLPIRYALGYDEDDGDGGTQTVTTFPTGGGTAENIVLVDSLIRNIASSMSFTTNSSDPSNNDLTAGSTVNGSWQDGAVRSYSSSTGKAWITVKAQLDTGIVGSNGSTRIVVSGTQDVEIDVSDIAGSSQGGSAGSVTITAADLGGSDEAFADRINARQNAAATLSKTTSTDLSISINARGVYNQGLYDGWDKAAAKVVYPKVSPATFTNGIRVVYPVYTESAATQSNYYNSTAAAEYFLNTGAEDGVYYAYIRYSNVNTGAIVAKRNIQSIYTAGQNSVTPTSAQLSQVVLSESSGIVTAKGTLTVPYTGNATGASLEVDVTDIYDIGYENGAEVSSYTASFDVTMTAPDGFTRVVRVDNVDCKDAYNAGARAAASQTTYKYVWGDHTDTASRTFPLWATADSAYSTIAQIPRNTQVELLDTSGSYAHISYTLNGVTHTGYTRAVYLHDGIDEIITWYACELHGNLLSVYTGSTSSALEGRLYPMTEVVEHTYWGTSNRAYIVCDGRYGYIDRIDLYSTRAGTSNYGQQTGWYSAATTMYIYNPEGEPVTVFTDDLLSSPYSKTIYPNTPVTVSNYSASAYSVMFTYDGGTYYIKPEFLSSSANSYSKYSQTGWYNGGGTTSYETLGVYSTGFNLNNCHVGVKYPDSDVLVVFNLLGSEEAVRQYPGDLYGTNTTNRMPVAVYASSQSYPESEAVGRTCYVLLSDGTKKQFTIQDSEPTA